MTALFQDIRYGLRLLAKSPGFAVVAMVTLALGIGANAAIFQLIDAVRLRTLPVRNPQTLAIIHLNTHDWGQGDFNGDYPEFTFPLWQQIRQRQQGFASLAAWGGERLNLASGGEVDEAPVIWVSGEFFPTLGVQPMLGRLISDADDQPDCASGVDISYSFWQRRYAGSASALGKQLTLEGHPFTILGVTQPSFYGVSVGGRFDIAVPVCAEPIIRGEKSLITGPTAREDWWLAIFGRLKPGWTLARAGAQLGAIAPAALHATIPPQYDAEGMKHYLGDTLELLPASNGFSELREENSTRLYLLLGLSGLVLLIACANLANLLLARASGREREVALRLALGASRIRLIRQMLSESALLAVGGAVAGGLLGASLSRLLVALISAPDDPVFLDMAVDWRVVGFAAALAMLTTMLFGLAPALRAGNAAPGAVLKAGGRSMTAGRGRFRLQRILVAAQVTLSLVLLTGALLFARSLRNLTARDPGFQQNGVLVANLDFTRLHAPTGGREALERDLLDRIRALPGAAAAAASIRSPAGRRSTNDWVVDDQGKHDNGASWLDYISPGYFATMQTPFLAGRDFDSTDTAASVRVAIVDQAFVKKYLGGGNALGKRFRIWRPPGEPEPYYTVVGVVKDSIYNDPHKPFPAIMYFARVQMDRPSSGVVYLVRSRAGLAGLADSVKAAILGVNPGIDIRFKLLRTQLRDSLLPDELMAALCGFFGGLAVLLAAIGLYGVISYSVAQRTNELGIRMALGAPRSGVLGMILGEVALLIAVGVVAGTGLTLAGSKAASSMLFGLQARDPLMIALAIVILAAIGLAASFIPARRASRLDPIAALRYE